MLSSHPARRAVERYWLFYTPVWGSVVGAIMVSGLAERWGDVELMILGVGAALGAVVPPIVRERGPLLQRTAFKLAASVVGFSFLMNYFVTPYFFEVLHMHFGFATRINIQNNPLFLYFLTVAYFATYCTLLCIAYRAARRMLPRVRWLAGALAAAAVALLETVLNANPFTRALFWFDDLQFMLAFGTLSYGLCLACALPVWASIDETEPTPLARVATGVLAATAAMLVGLELLRRLAPGP